MAMFGFSKKKKNAPDFQSPANMPMPNQPYPMAQQDFSNYAPPQDMQIPEYPPDQFNDINQAMPNQQYPQDFANPDVDYTMPPNPPAYMQNNGPIPPPMPEMPQQIIQRPETDKEKIEEIAEAIIDEKWKEILKDINNVIEWKETSEVRLVKIEQEITNLKENFDSLHKGVIGKIEEYDQNIVNVGTEIKAMEKVFQKILPTFTENVNKLSMVTKDLSKKR